MVLPAAAYLPAVVPLKILATVVTLSLMYFEHVMGRKTLILIPAFESLPKAALETLVRYDASLVMICVAPLLMMASTFIFLALPPSLQPLAMPFVLKTFEKSLESVLASVATSAPSPAIICTIVA